MREVAKMVRPSPLFPRARRRTGKAQSNWTATTDLVSRWPAAYFVWGFLGVGLISLAGAYWYANAYAPAPLSNAHALDASERYACDRREREYRFVYVVSFVAGKHGAALCCLS